MGPVSSLFDFLTFGALLFVFKAVPAEFQTAWFLESMATQILVIFVIRTNGRPWKDLPRPWLAGSTLAALVVAMVLPFTPLGGWFGFTTPPLAIVAALGASCLTGVLFGLFPASRAAGLDPILALRYE